MARKSKSSAKHMKPKGKRGMAQVKRLGRTTKTGGFARIERAAAARYGSGAAGERVAGKVFQNKARAHQRAMRGKR